MVLLPSSADVIVRFLISAEMMQSKQVSLRKYQTHRHRLFYGVACFIVVPEKIVNMV
jgi:hypothetical protein